MAKAAEPLATSPAPYPYRWRSARLALGTASALGLARFAYGLLVPAMRDQLDWSLARAGAMTTANGFGYLAGALAAAAVARRLTNTTAFRLGMAGTAVALAATAISGNYLALLAARVAAGLAGALVFVSGGVLAARLAARAGSAMPVTVYYAGTGLGIVGGGAALPPLLDQHSGRWPLAWVGLAAVAAVAAAVSWTATPAERETAAEATGRRQLRPLWRVAAAHLVFAAGYIAYITFLSAYLADHHASVPQVALVWTVLGLSVVAAPGLWNRPIAAWGGARALAALLAILTLAAALPLLSAALPVVLVSAVAYGATFMVVPAAITALIRYGMPPADWTPTLAAFTALFAAGQTAGPWLAGVLADHTTAAATLAWTAVLCAIAAGFAVTQQQPEPQPRLPA